MNIWIRRGLQLTVFSAGMFALGAGIASAADSGTPDGGNLLDPVGQVLSAPISVTGNAISVLGGDDAGGTASQPSNGGDASGSDAASIAVPVTVQRNAISVGGSGTTAETPAETAPAEKTPVVTAPTTGASSTLISAPVDVSDNSVVALGGAAGNVNAAAGASPAEPSTVAAVPVAVTDNSVAVLGRANADSATERPASAADDAAVPPEPSGAALVDAPVTLCGTDVSVLGDSTSTCAPPPESAGGSLVAAPVSVCGTSLGVLGGATAACPTYVAADYPQTPAEPIVGDIPGTSGGNEAVAGSADRPSVPAGGTEPEQLSPAIIEPEAASGSLSPSALPGATAGDLAYTGTNLTGLLAAGVLALLLGAGGTIGSRSRSHPRPLT